MAEAVEARQRFGEDVIEHDIAWAATAMRQRCVLRERLETDRDQLP